MEQTKLKPCPFCGGKVELKDKTSNFYGFNGYEIKCNCGCVMKSDLCSEMIFEGNKCSTPVTERGKSKALSDLVALWNGSADRKQSEMLAEFLQMVANICAYEGSLSYQTIEDGIKRQVAKKGGAE